MPEPTLRFEDINGVRLACWERGVPSADQPTLLFVHATGFHGRVFDRLLESFPDHHSLCLEQRGHGRSEKVRIEHWRTQGEDVAEWVRTLGLKNVIGVGHSMGAHALIDAAANCDAFSQLLLLDPTVASPASYAEGGAATEVDEHPAARRRAEFASPEEMIERLRPKGAYGLFEERILDDYCRYGLLPTADGRYELACPPAVEASVYMTSRTNPGILDSARAIEVPVRILRAMEPPTDADRMNFSYSPTWPGLVELFKQGEETYLADCTHFIPMQMPDLVIEAIRGEIDRWQTT